MIYCDAANVNISRDVKTVMILYVFNSYTNIA